MDWTLDGQDFLKIFYCKIIQKKRNMGNKNSRERHI